jgi:aryl-alcohol dehydrogenase-like predicted oxidoreductase
VLQELKAENKVKKIGFSLYRPAELKFLLEREVVFDLVQVPYSIFDRRFEPHFSVLRNRGVEIHVRSVFLQGLVFKDPSSSEVAILNLKDEIQAMEDICRESGLSRASLCLNFVTLNKFVDKVIVGIDSLEHFQEIMQLNKDQPKVESILERLDTFRVDNEEVLLPFNWEKNLVGV